MYKKIFFKKIDRRSKCAKEKIEKAREPVAHLFFIGPATLA
jgi:hypothetical protein